MGTPLWNWHWSTVTSLNIPFAVNKVVLGDGEAGQWGGRRKTTVGHPGGYTPINQNKDLAVQVAGS